MKNDLRQASGNLTLVEKLIQSGMLQQHRKWNRFFQEPKGIQGFVIITRRYEKQHSQVPYKLNPDIIRRLEEGEPIF